MLRRPATPDPGLPGDTPPTRIPVPVPLPLETSYADELQGLYVPWEGASVPDPKVVLLNRRLADALGLDAEALDSERGAELLTGAAAPEGSRPLAQSYAGHQFGVFSPRLGDGRALLMGEIVDDEGRLWDLHLKGSGPTPFSRGGDGKAVLGPVLREYLMGEAMHALGIPSTRALAALTTGERVVRRGGPKPGAVLARVASSHLRIGTFQYYAARGETDAVERLVEYALRRHDPHRLDAEDPALELFRAVRDRQAALVARWMGVGFVHGVMNTDNTSISGETLDYGPCAFMDAYDPGTVFSSIDAHGRYAFGRQPAILQWNLARFAETLLPVLEAEDEDAAVKVATAELEAFGPRYLAEWREVMGKKLGLAGSRDDDEELVGDFLDLLEEGAVDFTLAFRRLSDVLRGDAEPLRALFRRTQGLEAWLQRWRDRIEAQEEAPRATADVMDRVNPLYIPRNHLVEAALEAAETEGDPGPIRRLLQVLYRPYDRRPGLEAYEVPAPPDFGPYVTFCGT